MAYRKWIFRILRIVGATVLALILLTAAAVQFQQRLLRYRAEQLMADMHRIRLYQSTWADAQRLMHRWGAWGHYDGTCSAADCRYAIEIGDETFGVNEGSSINWFVRGNYFVRGSGLFGGRLAALRVTFTVHDGAIWRESAEVVVDVPAALRRFRDSSSEYSLIVVAKSRQGLLPSRDDVWILGDEDQLADHPYYKVGRPGGCENCFAAYVTFSTRAPQGEIDSLTNFDFSCFTRVRKCQWLGDLLPMAWDWRLYSHFEPGHTAQMEVAAPPRPCDMPLWVLGRDHNSVYAVQALSTGQKKEKDWDGPHEVDRVRIVSTLKGEPWRNGLELGAFPFPDGPQDPAMAISERLIPGKAYLLINEDHFDDPPGPWLKLDRCGVQDDTPENRRELAKGFAMNDNLRGPERW